MTKPKPTLSQQALLKAVELMNSEIRYLAAASDSARYDIEFGVRALARRKRMIEYKDELERMLKETGWLNQE